MAVAVIATGGKQYLVREGDELDIERLVAEPETSIDFTDILNGKVVKALVVRHDRDEKVNILKYKSKVRYIRRQGHRQSITNIKIESIA